MHAPNLPAGPFVARLPWKVLVVDDDNEVHTISRLVLPECSFEGRHVEVLSARSAAEAREVLDRNPDIALMLLDVVMETEYAGLELVSYVREQLKNQALRIVLRTGQPGQAPPLEMMRRYQIDDYRSKTELTTERLMLVTMAALRAYRQVRDLVEANRELEHFAHAASHDLQTPLRNIISMGQLLSRRLDEGHSKERELADHIVQAGHDLHKLIGSLLDYARLGRHTSPEETLQLDHVLARALGRLQALIKERGAAITAESLPVVVGHATEFEQLFTNLVENAIKYQPGPRPRVEITSRDTGDAVEIRVRDHGIGIESTKLEKIFEPFVRLHQQDEIPGSGVGLAICRKIVQRYGGTLRAESAPGEGTSMVIRLPVALPPATPSRSPRLKLR